MVFCLKSYNICVSLFEEVLMAKDMKTVLMNPRQFVPFWAEMRNVRVRGNGVIEGVNLQSAYATLCLDYDDLCAAEDIEMKKRFAEEGTDGKSPKIRRCTRESLELAWTEWPPQKMAQMRERAMEKLLAPAISNKAIDAWLEGVTGRVDELDRAVLKHVLWQVKRKAANRKVVFHLFPIFFGKQEGGKTTAIEKLLKPLEDYTLTLKVDEAADSRNAQSLTDNLLCFFDEMANMARVDMESLKRLVTSDYLTYRILGTHHIAKVRQNCTFIGGSNKSLTELVYDPTGMRRFYQFSCLDVLNHKLINETDYQAIWDDINVEMERGYIEPYLEQLRAHQGQHQTEDEVQQFLREMAVTGGSETTEVTAAKLYDSYVAWRSVSGYSVKPALAANSFGMRLSSYKITRKVKTVGRRTHTVYHVNKDSAIFENRAVDNVLTMQKGNA